MAMGSDSSAWITTACPWTDVNNPIEFLEGPCTQACIATRAIRPSDRTAAFIALGFGMNIRPSDTVTRLCVLSFSIRHEAEI